MTAMTSRPQKLLGAAFAATVLFVACGGPREPGSRPNETVYWKVTKSDVEFGQCTDDPLFRDQIKPVEFSENSYFVYRVEQDGTKATNMACTSFAPSSCVKSEPELVFDVAGNELNLTRQLKNPIGDGGCQLQTTQQWVATDKGTAMDLDVSNTMSLVDHPTECERIEQDVKSQSPNQLGFQGCVVTYKLGFTHE